MDHSLLPIVEAPAIEQRTLAERRCGECTACCVHLPIAAGLVSAEAKPAGTPCGELCEQGCGSYDRRPNFCRAFRCAWHKHEHWPTEWRPQESGLICLQEPLSDGQPAAVVYETRAEALRSPQAAEMLQRLHETSTAVAIVGFHGNRQLRLGKLSIEEIERIPPKPHFDLVTTASPRRALPIAAD